MRIVIGSDHAGFPLKSTIVDHIRSLGHEVHDAGSYDPNPVDFPDIAKAVTSAIIEGKAERGLMVCGTGVGASIAANKVKGIRAAVCHDIHSAHQSVEHDDVKHKKLEGGYLLRRLDIRTSFRSSASKSWISCGSPSGFR